MKEVKWLYGFVKKYKWMLCFGLFLTTMVAVLSLVTPYLSGEIVDQVIMGKKYTKLTWMVGGLLSATLLKGLLRAAYLMTFESSSQNIIYDMRAYVYKRLQQQDFDFYNKNRTGDLLSRQTGDMDAIRRFFAYTMYATYENVILFVVALIMIFTVNVKLALCMLLVLPFTACATFIQVKKARPVYQNIRNHFSSLNSFAQENISGNRVVKAFAKEEYEKEKFDVENAGYMEAQLQNARLTGIFIPIFEFLSNALFVILMLIGGIMVVNGEITAGKIVTVNGYLWMLNNPLRMAGWLVNDIQHMAASIEKIYDTVMKEPMIKSGERVCEKKRLSGDVIFDNVSYQADGEEILHNVSFQVKSGETIGIIGATGTGKTTVMNLLCRFVDATEGQVLVDGRNVKEMDLYQLRDNIGMAMQDVFLFSDTIANNIAYGRSDCEFEKIVRVAKIANAHQFIEETPDGYETIIGERGMGLSGGQKQRISLARALLKEPSIIILDDTTSAVDMETESMIQKELREIQKNTTVFIIAHRISSIIDADRILVFDAGRLIEEGSHQQLIEKDGYYASVFRHQYGEFEIDRKQMKKKNGGQRYGQK